MRMRTASIGMLSTSFAALLCAAAVNVAVVQPAAAQQVRVDADDIGGVVTGAKGPEAGVWVIAETKDLPTKYVKIVVTDDQGRYLLPDLPKGNYDIWVRGYGLVDSPKVKSAPGKTLDLKAVAAPNRAAAAQYYPAQYWYSMMKVPAANLFPGTGPTGNNMSQQMADQGVWLRNMKTDGCVGCHQLGDKATRTIPAALGTFRHRLAAWERRLQSGTGQRPHDGRHRPLRHAARAGDVRRLDRSRRQGRTAQNRSAASRRASSAISSSRNGIGIRPRPICMTRSRPTATIRRSTRMASSTDRRKRARISFRGSIRSTTSRVC